MPIDAILSGSYLPPAGAAQGVSRGYARQGQSGGQPGAAGGAGGKPGAVGGAGGKPGAAGGAGGGEQKNAQGLTPEEEREVAQLQARDAAVRAHEAAHRAAGGNLASAARFSYQTGPDGKRYAVGGEVSIDVSEERNPQATINKMNRVEAAALAPANPSPQDRAVARTAESLAVKAQQELRAAQSSGTPVEPGRIIDITV